MQSVIVRLADGTPRRVSVPAHSGVEPCNDCPHPTFTWACQDCDWSVNAASPLPSGDLSAAGPYIDKHVAETGHEISEYPVILRGET